MGGSAGMNDTLASWSLGNELSEAQTVDVSSTSPDAQAPGIRLYSIVSRSGGPFGSASVKVVDANESAPWWQGRLVASRKVVTSAAFAGVAPLDQDAREDEPLGTGDSGFSHVLGAVLVSGNSLSLDFGRHVTVAAPGLFLLDPRWGSEVEDTEDWLRPDSFTDFLAAEPPVDDTEWDNRSEGPEWLSLDESDYLGGGIMGRRRENRLSE